MKERTLTAMLVVGAFLLAAAVSSWIFGSDDDVGCRIEIYIHEAPNAGGGS